MTFGTGYRTHARSHSARANTSTRTHTPHPQYLVYTHTSHKHTAPRTPHAHPSQSIRANLPLTVTDSGMRQRACPSPTAPTTARGAQPDPPCPSTPQRSLPARAAAAAAQPHASPGRKTPPSAARGTGHRLRDRRYCQPHHLRRCPPPPCHHCRRWDHWQRTVRGVPQRRGDPASRQT